MKSFILIAGQGSRMRKSLPKNIWRDENSPLPKTLMFGDPPKVIMDQSNPDFLNTPLARQLIFLSSQGVTRHSLVTHPDLENIFSFQADSLSRILNIEIDVISLNPAHELEENIIEYYDQEIRAFDEDRIIVYGDTTPMLSQDIPNILKLDEFQHPTNLTYRIMTDEYPNNINNFEASSMIYYPKGNWGYLPIERMNRSKIDIFGINLNEKTDFDRFMRVLDRKPQFVIDDRIYTTGWFDIAKQSLLDGYFGGIENK